MLQHSFNSTAIPGRLLIDAVHKVARYVPVSCVARQKHESAKTMVDETLHSLEINALNRHVGKIVLDVLCMPNSGFDRE